MGSAILYYLFIIPISALPLFILFGISNFMYVMMYYVFGYRKKVIADNIYKSFPEKSETEKKRIVKEFYKHFCDLIIESIKNFTITKKQVLRRFTVKNPEVLDKYYNEGKSVVMIGGHYGSWELYALAISMLVKHQHLGIYKPLSNNFFDGKMRSSREKFGLKMIPMKATRSYFEMEHEKPIAVIFGSDQWPSNAKNSYWTTFLGRETPFLFGAEKYSKEFDYPVIYGEIIKVKRGKYQLILHDITDKPNDLAEGEIIETYVQLLEKTIRERKPEHWLWSHRRWKRTKEEVFSE